MSITVDKLINDDRFSGDNVIQFLLYLPFGLVLVVFRTVLGLILWIASIILPNKSSVRQLLSILACCTFGVYVKVKGSRDQRCGVLAANYVSALDSLAAAHVFGTITLRKWKVPPFFASALGIRNAAQFARKASGSSSGVGGGGGDEALDGSCVTALLAQPEGGPTNGRGLLRFAEWPLAGPLPARVQPLAIRVERAFTAVTVHRSADSAEAFPWSDVLWYLWTPVTRYSLTLLPPLDRQRDDDVRFIERLRASIALHLQVEVTAYSWEEVRGAASGAGRNGAGGGGTREARGALLRQARQVREVLPRVPLDTVLRDLARTRSVDVTITNLLEGVTPYTPEPEPEAAAAAGAEGAASPRPAPPATQPSTSRAASAATPATSAVFPKSAKERQTTFQERKAQMIATARQRYIEKHGLNVA